MFKYKNINIKINNSTGLNVSLKMFWIRHLDINFYSKSDKKNCFNVIKPTKMSKANNRYQC